MTAQILRFKVTASDPTTPEPIIRLVQARAWQGACRLLIDELTSHDKNPQVKWDNGTALVSSESRSLVVRAELG
jgi:hypothetical protein